MLRRVFISYRHENDRHAQDVRQLAQRLRDSGFPVSLDQFYLDECPGGPSDGGWPKWCEEQASNSACSLIIGSPGWFSAYRNDAPSGVGCGSACEALIFRQTIYRQRGDNDRIRLAFLDATHESGIPDLLEPWRRFRPLDSTAEMDGLVRWIASCLEMPAVSIPAVSWPAPIPFRPSFAGRRETEWAAVIDLLSRNAGKRALLIEGASGLGKSTFLREAGAYARALRIPVVDLNLKAGFESVAAILAEFDLAAGSLLPNFSRERGANSHLLRKDMRSCSQPLLVLIDSYETARGNSAVENWIDRQLLPEVETSPCLAVVVAGQLLPNDAIAPWLESSLRLRLGPIDDVGHWREWLDRTFPGFPKEADINTLVLATEGNPLTMRMLCEAIARSNRNG